MMQKIWHCKSRLELKKKGYLHEMTDYAVFRQNFGGVMGNPFVSKNHPFDI